MIEEVAARIDTGSGLARQAGTKMAEVVDSEHRVSGIIAAQQREHRPG